MGYSNKRIWFYVITNILLFALILVLGLLSEFGILPSYKSGFYCNDPNLSFPYYENDTIPTSLLGVVAAIGPLLIIGIVEYINNFDKSSPMEMRKPMQLIFLWYREYMVSLGLNLIIVQVMKVSIGKPRPCFFELCHPIAKCSALDTSYVDTFECSNTAVSTHTLLDASRSFPSGHASISVQTALFMFLYIKRRCKGPWMLGISLQVLCLMWGSFTPLSRVTDYRHHWWDVLAGSFVGIIFTIYAVYLLCRNFATEEKSSSKNFTLVIDRLTSRKLNHVVDNNNTSRDVDLQPV